MTNISIRPAREEEFDTWYPLWRGYQTFYKADIPQAVSLLTWSRFFDDVEPMRCYLAEVDNKVVGFVHTIDHRTCWAQEPSCYLQDLFVDPELRGHGVGRKLIEHVYGEAGGRGCGKVHWLTHETNEVAMKLYDRIAEKPGFLQYRKML